MQRISALALPNGWRVTPEGREVSLPGDMPGAIILVDNGSRALVNTCGYHDHSVNLIDLKDGRIVSTVPFRKSWVGLAVRGDEVLESAGAGSGIHRIALDGMKPLADFALPDLADKDRFVSSILVGKMGTYALNIQSDEVFLLGW